MKLQDRQGDADGGGRDKWDMPPAERSKYATALLRQARATLCDAKVPMADQQRILRMVMRKIEAVT